MLVGFDEELRHLPLTDGAEIGTALKDAKTDAKGVAGEHVRVNVRSDGYYLEDLGAPDGMYVNGVRVRRVGLSHGDVVRLGDTLGIFVERDLGTYAGVVKRTGTLVHGPRQQANFVDPFFHVVKSGSSVCIEGAPGTGKRTMARLAAAAREGVGDIVTVDGSADDKPTVPAGVRPMTWVVLEADRLPRPQQLEIAHAVDSTNGAVVIVTVSQPLDRAVGDGKLAPWFASHLEGKCFSITPLEHRREDIPAIVREVANRCGIALELITPTVLDAIVSAGWPGGVPQIAATLVTAANATAAGSPFELSTITSMLVRANRTKPSLAPATDLSHLEDVLAQAINSIDTAARSLGMSRQAIYREAERLGLDIARKLPNPNE